MSRITVDVSSITNKPRSVQWIMLQVCFALIPGTCLYAILVSGHVVTNVIIAAATALICEALCMWLRKRSAMSAVSDGSALLAAILLALAVPPTLPAWQLIIGTAVLVLLGKQVFGGLGHNPFNPAMVAYAFLLISFPVTMTAWDNPGLNQVDVEWSAITMATPLDYMRSIDITGTTNSIIPTNEQITNLIFDTPWPIIALGWLLGGIYLIVRRVISWHIPSSVLLSIFVLYISQNIIGNEISLPAFPAIFTGAILFGAFFIATDPVTAARSKTGQLLFGTGIGFLCFFIREYSAYPEGFAFAILLMNMTVPLIDRLDALFKKKTTISS